MNGTKQVIIRKAALSDREDVSRLHVMAGPNVYSYCFGCDEEKAVAINRLLFETPDTFCSRQYYYVCGSPAGAEGLLGIYPGRDNEALGRNVGRYIRGIAGITGPLSILKMMVRSGLFRRMPALGDDELYIEALAVYPHYRGHGVSSALLNFAFEECVRMKLSVVSLFAEINNDRALAVYHHKGFRVADSVELPPRFRRHGLYGFHKMTAPAAAKPR